MTSFHPRVVIDLDNKIEENFDNLFPEQSFDKFRKYCFAHNYDSIEKMDDHDIGNRIRNIHDPDDKEINLFAGGNMSYIVIILSSNDERNYDKELGKVKSVTSFENEEYSVVYISISSKYLNVDSMFGIRKCWQFIFPHQIEDGTIPTDEEYYDIRMSFFILLILLNKRDIFEKVIDNRGQILSGSIKSSYYDNLKFRELLKPYIVNYYKNHLINNLIADLKDKNEYKKANRPKNCGKEKNL